MNPLKSSILPQYQEKEIPKSKTKISQKLNIYLDPFNYQKISRNIINDNRMKVKIASN